MEDLEDERVGGPSSKWTRAALPRQGESVDVEDEWRHRIVDMLEISNAEHHAVWTQLEGIRRRIEYLAGMAWKLYTVNCGSLTSG